jgi:hypothetical protein
VRWRTHRPKATPANKLAIALVHASTSGGAELPHTTAPPPMQSGARHQRNVRRTVALVAMTSARTAADVESYHAAINILKSHHTDPLAFTRRTTSLRKELRRKARTSRKWAAKRCAVTSVLPAAGKAAFAGGWLCRLPFR